MRDPRRLDVDAIIATAERLEVRVCERFPERGIARLAHELTQVATETRTHTERLDQPRWGLRALVALTGVAAVTILVLTITQVDSGPEVDRINDLLGLIESLVQDLVFLGLGAVFLVGVEGRLKRRDVLRRIHELRSFAHIIDMHQLTKDPDGVFEKDRDTEHSPERIRDPFVLSRYLDYCSEMLSLTSKLAATYAERNQDAVVLGAVRDVQDLTGLLSAKIWQKRVVLDAGIDHGTADE